MKPSAVTLEELLKSAKNEFSCNSPPVRSSYCETSPALSCFWKSILRVFEGGCFPAFPTTLVFSVFGQCRVCESLKILSVKIGFVLVSCVAASLAFPASSASGT